MKKILIFVWLNMFLQCHTQKNSENMNYSIDNRFERFNKILDKSRIDELINNELIVYTSANIGFGEGHYNFNNYFVLIKNYYPSRNIQNKGVAFNEGSPIGIWYYFDESGKLIKEENTDEGYDFTPEDVVKYCERNKIKLTKGYQETGYKTSVYKRETDNTKVWEITYLITQGKEDKTEQVILDGKTGKVLKKLQGIYTGN